MKATFLRRLNFLPAPFEENKNYSNVVCARSVLSALIKPVNGIEFGKQILVKIFIEGFSHLITCLPGYNFVWNIKGLFNDYRNSKTNEEIEIKSITIKTVKLLALLLYRRTQAIHTLDLQFIKFGTDSVHIAFPEILKQSRPVKHLKSVKLNSFNTEPVKFAL